jgi:hypothetical protein
VRCRELTTDSQFAESIGLGPHAVLDGSGRSVTLWLPIDAEVHRGRDGHLYVIDLARLMPPVPPSEESAHMYRHFRPEFVAAQRLRLSSDAFSKFAGTREPHTFGPSCC